MASGIYSTGTATVVTGGRTVTLIGAIVNGINFSKYDTIVIGDGSATILDISEADSELTITPWQGSSQTAQAYENHQSGSLRYDDVKIAESLRAQTAALDTRGFYVFVPPGATAPDPSLGDNEQYAFQADTGKLWQKVGGLWSFIGVYKGINPKGAWDSGTAYAVNDVVSRNGNAYMAIAANTNSQPPSANWMLLGTGGADAQVTATATTGAPGSSVTVTNGGTPTNRTLGFTIPRGSVVTVGPTTTGAPGTSSAVTNGGTGGDVRLDLTVPEGRGYRASSTSSVTIGTGSKTFTIQSGLAYQAGAYARLSNTANTANFIEGTITAYNDSTGSTTMAVARVGGSGTFAAWSLNVVGERGAAGAGTGDVLASNNGTDFPDKALFRSNVGAVGGPVSSTDWQRAASDGATGKQIKYGATIDPLDRIDAKPWSVLRGADLGLIPNFTRASAKTMLDSAGVLQTFASGVPAITDRGILVEESATNLIRNPRCEGAVAGSPGTLPTYWGDTLASGLTRQIVGSGTINGVDYVDVRISGSSTSSGSWLAEALRLEGYTYVTAASGDTLTLSAFLAVVAGTLSGNVAFVAEERTAAANVKYNTSLVSITGALTRLNYTVTLSGGGTVAYVVPTLWLYGPPVASTPIDFTLRIGAPQCVKAPFVTSVILPPVGSPAQATRAADVITRTRTSPTALSKVIRARTAAGLPSGVSQVVWNIDDGTSDNRIYVARATSSSIFLVATIAGSAVLSLNMGAVADNTDFAIAFRATGNDWAASLNGGAVVTNTSAAMPTGLVTERWGRRQNGSYWNAPISLDAEWSSLLTNTQLQALSA